MQYCYNLSEADGNKAIVEGGEDKVSILGLVSSNLFKVCWSVHYIRGVELLSSSLSLLLVGKFLSYLASDT